jgi:large conductance mechanosensitive channel
VKIVNRVYQKAAAATPPEVALLTEIRDLLKSRQ